MLRCSSGSSTGRSASMTSASVIGMGGRCSLLIDDRLGGDPVGLGGPGPDASRPVRRPQGGRRPAVGRIPTWPDNHRPGSSFPARPAIPMRHPRARWHDATEFASAVTAITSAFGDPTRREIYLFAHDSETGVTATEMAERFDLHPNVARHHLDKLVAGGYLEVSTERPRRPGAGRPSKRYRAPIDAAGQRGELEVTCRSATTTCSSPCWARRSSSCRPTRPSAWPKRSASSTAARSPPDGDRRRALVPHRTPRGGRRAHRPRLRRPRRAARHRAAHRLRALPLRRRRRRAPGHLRRRPRPGAGHARLALRRGVHPDRIVAPDGRRRSASPPSTTTSPDSPCGTTWTTRRPRRCDPRPGRRCAPRSTSRPLIPVACMPTLCRYGPRSNTTATRSPSCWGPGIDRSSSPREPPSRSPRRSGARPSDVTVSPTRWSSTPPCRAASERWFPADERHRAAGRWQRPDRPRRDRAAAVAGGRR